MTERFRLLIIDDDVVDRLAIRRAIEHSDLDAAITEAATADEAMQQLTESFDCLLLDYDLPGSTGTELTRRLRASGNHTPVVLVTGQQNEELLQAAVDAGITDFLPKSDLTARRVALRIRFAIRIGRAEAQSQKLLE
ncbi:MAG: response regulator, partial [Myxococcales bacterium]|nr:response regulator [Myxococcales bacterium]